MQDKHPLPSPQFYYGALFQDVWGGTQVIIVGVHVQKHLKTADQVTWAIEVSVVAFKHNRSHKCGQRLYFNFFSGHIKKKWMNFNNYTVFNPI